MGDFIGPFVGGNRTQAVNFNPARGRQVFNLLEQVLISRGAENFTNTHGQCQGDGAQAECPADPVDQHCAAGTRVSLEQRLISRAQIT
ncbi:hypothetical protein D3C81_1915370 [compost metagenome]